MADTSQLAPDDYWLDRFGWIVRHSSAALSPISLALLCKSQGYESIVDMYAALTLEVPSDILRHRIQAEVRAINKAQDTLELAPIGRIDNRWPHLENTVLAHLGATA